MLYPREIITLYKIYNSHVLRRITQVKHEPFAHGYKYDYMKQRSDLGTKYLGDIILIILHETHEKPP